MPLTPTWPPTWGRFETKLARGFGLGPLIWWRAKPVEDFLASLSRQQRRRLVRELSIKLSGKAARNER